MLSFGPFIACSFYLYYMETSLTVTVGDMIRMLQAYNPDLPLDFGGLTFYRIKDRGAHVHVEFSQSVYQDEQGNVVVENH